MAGRELRIRRYNQWIRRSQYLFIALSLIWWATIATFGGALEQSNSYGWITVPAIYVTLTAFAIGIGLLSAIVYPANWLCRGSAMLAAAFWCMIGFNLAMWNPAAPGWGVYGALCLLSTYLFFLPGISFNDRFEGWFGGKRLP